MATRIQFRRGNSSDWSSSNPLLAQGEIGLELDTNRQKFGDGINYWNDLPYADGYSTTQLTSHVNSQTPHPAYDDMQDLTILFENGLV